MSSDRPPWFQWVYVTDHAFGAFKHLVTWAAVTVIAYFVADAVKALAGQETIAEIVLRVLVPLSLRSWPYFAVPLAALGFAYHQYRLRKRAIAEMAGRIVYLERLLDPGRTSSLLTRVLSEEIVEEVWDIFL